MKTTELKQNPARALKALENKFKKVARKRPNYAEHFKRAMTDRSLTKEFRMQSSAHHRATGDLLRIIERYAQLHKRTKTGQNITLPRAMRDELNRLKVRRSLTTSAIHLKTAVEAHNRKRAALATRVEQLLAKHGSALGF
ncbi:MAG: hypothetical protein V1644_02085 [Candidatus Micrarchaeota archaeon]